MTKTIIITGNPVDGFRYLGFWDTDIDAIDWAESQIAGADWWIASVTEIPLNLKIGDKRARTHTGHRDGSRKRKISKYDDERNPTP